MQENLHSIECFNRDADLEKYRAWKDMINYFGPGINCEDLFYWKSKTCKKLNIREKAIPRKKKSVIEWFDEKWNTYKPFVFSLRRLSNVNYPKCKADQINRLTSDYKLIINHHIKTQLIKQKKKYQKHILQSIQQFPLAIQMPIPQHVHQNIQIVQSELSQQQQRNDLFQDQPLQKVQQSQETMKNDLENSIESFEKECQVISSGEINDDILSGLLGSETSGIDESDFLDIF